MPAQGNSGIFSVGGPVFLLGRLRARHSSQCESTHVSVQVRNTRMKPDYARVRVPVLAIYQAQHPFEEVAAGYAIRNDQEPPTRDGNRSARRCPDGSNRGTDRREPLRVSVERG